MRILPRLVRSLALLALLGAGNGASAQADCGHYALVSGYFSNNVHVYDGCSGAFLRLLDPEQGRLRGAQATRVGPDGLLWVVSERSNQVHRYRSDDFSFVDSPIDVGTGFDITGIAFSGDDGVYASGYASSTVRLYHLDGTLQSTPVPSNAGVFGPDNGMTLGPDGMLYVPGFDSHNVLRYNPTNGASSVIVPADSGGLRNARGILFRPDGATFLVTGEGSGQINEYRSSDGGFVRTLASALSGPTGMAFGPDGDLVVVTSAGVLRLDPASGARRNVLVAPLAGGLRGPTFITFLPKAEGLDTTQIGSQFWISGAGRLEGNRVVVDMTSTTGPAFGAGYDPADVVAKRWGRLDIDFTSCTTATLRWTSNGSDGAGFGSGGYPLTRFLPGAGAQRCMAAGFAQSPPEDWLQGTWSGGASRNGEGLTLEYFNASTIVVAWFTHRPAGVP